MLTLTWNDIDFRRNTIAIDETLYGLGKHLYINTTKTASGNCVIVMPRFLAAMLRDYQRRSVYTSK